MEITPSVGPLALYGIQFLQLIVCVKVETHQTQIKELAAIDAVISIGVTEPLTQGIKKTANLLNN